MLMRINILVFLERKIGKLFFGPLFFFTVSANVKQINPKNYNDHLLLKVMSLKKR